MAKPAPKPKPPRASEAPSGPALPSWAAAALAKANERGPYPTWVTGTAKAMVAVALLTWVADWAAQRSARADLARLVTETSRAKPEPTKTGALRR